MDGTSLTPQEIKLQQLKELLPEAFTEGKIDWEKLQLTLGRDINLSNERYVLNWAGKSEAFRALQTPATRTLIPAKEESINFDETENIFIEGENLEVLKILQRSYFNKIKMIYIDPPYNTGNDSFIYPDKFSETKEDYQKRVGDKDEEGYMTKEGLYHKNSKENGQYHSNWLNMMYPRLFLAKNLLKDDGVIFVSIDDHEVHNLRNLMDEIFGEENFLGNIVRSTGQTTGQDSGGLGSSFDYLIAYSKTEVDLSGLPLTEKDLKRFENEDERGKFAYDQMRKTGSNDKREDRPKLYYPVLNPDGEKLFPVAPAGYESCWRFEKKTYDRLNKENYILWKKSKRGDTEIWWPYVKYYLEGRTKRPSPLWDDIDGNKKASRDLRALFEGKKLFDFPKPTQLIKRLIQIVPNASNDDLIIDFFAGSGTTAHAVFELNSSSNSKRKFINIQIAEKTEEKSEAFKQGYNTIADLAKERIRRASAKIQKENPEYKGDLGFKVLKLSDSNFKQWRKLNVNDEKALEKQLDIFVDPVSENAVIENMVYELLLKSGKDLNSKVEHKENLYIINDGELILMLEQADQETVKTTIEIKPTKVIALDRLFKGNDQLKTNTALQMKDAGIEFKTI